MPAPVKNKQPEKTTRFVGAIVYAKIKETAKGQALAYMLKTDKGNLVWFMVWDDNKDYAAPKSTHKPDLASVHCSGQVLTIDGVVSEMKDQENAPGKKMAFVKPNPKLISASPLTAEMKMLAQYADKFDALDDKRLAAALVALHANFLEQLEPNDSDFISSLAEGCKKYNSCTAKQRPHIIRLLAKYTGLNTAWRKAVDESLKHGFQVSEPTHEADDGAGGYSAEDF